MAKAGNQTWKKRTRELAKQEKRQEKLQRRLLRKEDKPDRKAQLGGEDPDLIGIKPGPQPNDLT